MLIGELTVTEEVLISISVYCRDDELRDDEPENIEKKENTAPLNDQPVTATADGGGGKKGKKKKKQKQEDL